SEIAAVGGGILRDDEELFHAGGDEALGLAQHLGGRPRAQLPAQLRDDAEAAAVIAALGNLEIGVVPRRELDALRRHQVEKRIGASALGSSANQRPAFATAVIEYSSFSPI